MKQKKAQANIHQNPSTKQNGSGVNEELSSVRGSLKVLEYANED